MKPGLHIMTEDAGRCEQRHLNTATILHSTPASHIPDSVHRGPQSSRHVRTRVSQLAFPQLLILAAVLLGPQLSAARRHPRGSQRAQQVRRLRELNVATPAGVSLSQIAEGIKGDLDWDAAWRRVHYNYVQEVQDSEEAGNRWQFLFIGDTNVEALRGTYRGSSWSLFQQGPKHWKMHFKSYRAAPFGLAGDGIKQLAYRLLDGEFPQKYPPDVVALAIGSGDLHPPACTKEASQAVKEGWRRVIAYIREQAPSSQILALGILPKGDDWPNGCTNAIQDVNAYLKDMADSLDNVHFLNLERHFLRKKQSLSEQPSEGLEIKDHFMPDTLNIANLGIARLCIEVHHVVDKLLGTSYMRKAPS